MEEKKPTFQYCIRRHGYNDNHMLNLNLILKGKYATEKYLLIEKVALFYNNFKKTEYEINYKKNNFVLIKVLQ